EDQHRGVVIGVSLLEHVEPCPQTGERPSAGRLLQDGGHTVPTPLRRSDDHRRSRVCRCVHAVDQCTAGENDLSLAGPTEPTPSTAGKHDRIEDDPCPRCGAQCSRCQSPDLPPDFATGRTSEIEVDLSIPLTMSITASAATA